MAIQNKLVDMKLQIRVEDTSTGETKVKNLKLHTHQVCGDK